MKTSHLIRVYKPNKVISPQDMLNGLKMNGIDNDFNDFSRARSRAGGGMEGGKAQENLECA